MDGSLVILDCENAKLRIYSLRNVNENKDLGELVAERFGDRFDWMHLPGGFENVQTFESLDEENGGD